MAPWNVSTLDAWPVVAKLASEFCLADFSNTALAHSFERKEQFDLALPLFFQALRLCKDQCHMAVISRSMGHP